MYRLLSRTAGSHSVCVHGPCRATCGKESRTLNGVKTLSTSSFRLCEKKDPPAEGETTKAESESGRTKRAEQQVEPVVLKEGDGQTIPREAGVEQVCSKPGQVKADKSAKKNLLDLLGSMKVEVTSKRMQKDLKLQKRFEPAVKYQSKPEAMESTKSMFQKSASQSKTLGADLIAAASAAAATLPNSRQARLELLKQLRQRKALTEAQRSGDTKIRVIIANMKVRKPAGHQKASPTDQIQFDDDDKQGCTHAIGTTGKLAEVQKRRDMFSANKLNIFSTSANIDEAEPAVAKPTLWDVEFANKLSLVTNQLPRNRFEEMIQWSKEGKLWQYPINNEIGLEEEASVPFHEHVFLEKHLEDGFPQQGPVRHFMELVLAGLSKNPYMTVLQKKEHISWFRDYFHQKEEVLNDADVYLS